MTRVLATWQVDGDMKISSSNSYFESFYGMSRQTERKKQAACYLDRQSCNTMQRQLLTGNFMNAWLPWRCSSCGADPLSVTVVALTLSAFRIKAETYPSVIVSLRMSVSDFRHQFELMEVCHLTDSLRDPGSGVQPWSYTMHHGNWVPNVTAGGSHSGGEANDGANTN